MTTFNFNNQPTATVTKETIFDLFSQLDLTWHGMNEFGRYEQELIEDKLNIGIQIIFKDGVKRTSKNTDNIENYDIVFHDNNYDWEKEENEDVCFDNDTKELTIEDTVFTLQSFDNNNFARLVEQHTLEFTNSFFYGIGEMPKGSKKFKSGLLNGVSERIRFIENSAEHSIFKGRELKILKAIQKGKKLCIH